MDISRLENMLDEISPERIESHLDNLAEIGKDQRGGITRLAYSPEESEAYEYLKNTIKGYFNIRVDPVGNMYFEPTGDISRDAITLMGSHLDTVPMGGKYDGTTGVVSALEALACIQKYNSQLANRLCVVSFRAEEGARFNRSLLGSSATIGELSYEELNTIKDENGITLEKAIKECGFEPERISEAKINHPVSAFMELHIEQGPVLQRENCPIGIVTGIAAAVRYKIEIHGRYNHSGTTPMGMRKDAGLISSRINLLINDICNKVYSKNRNTVGTVGKIEIPGGSINKVPGEAILYVDIRSVDICERDKTVERIIKKIRKIERDEGVKIDIKETENKKPVFLSPGVYNPIKEACEKLNIKYKMMPSGAGHDAMNLAKMGVLTGMIFVPCDEGRSHCPDEYAKIDDIVKGTKVLLTTCYSMSNY